MTAIRYRRHSLFFLFLVFGTPTLTVFFHQPVAAEEEEQVHRRQTQYEDGFETIEVNFGVPQQIFPRHAGDATKLIIEQTEHYMRETVMKDRAYRRFRGRCSAIHAFCSFWAATAQCIENPPYMHRHCSATCQTCHLLDEDINSIDENSSPVVGKGEIMIAQVWGDVQREVKFSLVPKEIAKPRRRRTKREREQMKSSENTPSNRYKYGSRRRRAREEAQNEE